MKLFLSFLFLSLLSFAETNHETTCSEVTKVCATIHTEKPFTTKEEGQFQLFLDSSDSKETSLVKIDLWMQMGGHGHGSSPLTVTDIAAGEYQITKAYFVMKGTWQIRVTYEQDEEQEQLIIPVKIQQ